ncbi:NusG domain II-containing protein [Romboutsia ilealis]|uniref:NusG domain II-containing protein n=1 Tax=Romboutsia faecis TaxID=2764597 RepID=A0ABR7JL41_9FIRM|nr:NusG domain II-containing protein [Romboutsia faecis]MBC5995644.1 NusG domain II-containing protein [Romboutsia faecis]MRN23846.1 NusG domain II-containing protein [Romboutsia ilealis]
MKKKDILLVSSIIFMIIVLFIVNNNIDKEKSEAIEIYVNNEIYKTVSINDEEDLIIETGSEYNHIKIHDGGVEMVDASCADNVCVDTGFISKISERIVCMPNKVVIKVKKLESIDNKEDVISE